MTDFVYCQNGDWNSGQHLGFLSGRGNAGDYVEEGLEIPNVDYETSQFRLSEGKVYALLDADTEPNTGETRNILLVAGWLDERTNLPLAGSGTNHVYISLNYGEQDAPSIDVNTTGDLPSDGSVKIAEIDTGTQTVTEVNRDPDGTFETLAADDVTVRDQITWPDGATTDTHPITYGETLDNRNDYYDEEAADPPGVVDQAAASREADWSREARSAESAAHAGNSDLLEGYTADELLAEAESLRAQPWEPVFDQPYVNDSYDDRPDASFDVSGVDYDYYRVRLQVENDNSYSDALGCYINGIDDNVYNQLNLLPREEYGERVVHRTGTDTWTIGSTAGNSHSIHEFTVSLPAPIVSNGPRYRFPVFNAATQLTGGDFGSYQLAGNLTRSVDAIEEIRLETGGGRLAIRAQVYGRMLFPEQYD